MVVAVFFNVEGIEVIGAVVETALVSVFFVVEFRSVSDAVDESSGTPGY